MIDALATVNDTGTRWTLALVNRHPDQEVTCTVKMKDRPLEGRHGALILAGDSPDADNDIEHPDRVVPQTTTLTFTRGTVRLPPHSLVIVKLP